MVMLSRAGTVDGGGGPMIRRGSNEQGDVAASRRPRGEGVRRADDVATGRRAPQAGKAGGPRARKATTVAAAVRQGALATWAAMASQPGRLTMGVPAAA